ncbi:MAG: glutamate 5-kinase [Actinobacteria bacterium]|nr:glutamate 5-kinase [Actinomycetota bacterium]
MRGAAAGGRPVVVKVGSSSLTGSAGLDEGAVGAIVDQIAGLRGTGILVALVTSGAVAAGLPALGMVERPSNIPDLQVAAAVGQGRLMETYTRLFAAHGLVAGQVLLTRDVLSNRDQYLHAKQALGRMLGLGVVPIVNENDTVVVDELRLGDNDRLAAIVSHLTGAGMLVILTDTAGLFSGDPQLDDTAELLDAVRSTDAALEAISEGGAGPLGSGGVATKVAAARMAAWSGVPTVIASSRMTGVMAAAVAGDAVGTWVEPHASSLSARKLWIAFGMAARGTVAADRGAVRALVVDGRSLLSVGVTAVIGDFTVGDAVEVLGPDGALIGKGRVAIGAVAVRAAMGRHSSDAGGVVIHRDDLVVLTGGTPPAELR